MGERNNGYASCDLRGLRGLGNLGGLGGSQRRACGEVGGYTDNTQRDGNEGCGRCGQPRKPAPIPPLGRGNSGCGCNAPREGKQGCSCNAWRDGERAYESDRPREGACADRGAHAMMHKLQELDFSIQETVLYLNAYPDCAAARKHYHQLVCERRALADKYEKQYGPLNTCGNVDHDSWDWIRGPWPWHPEFPGNKKG